MERSLQFIFVALLLMCFNGCLKYQLPTAVELDITTLTMEVGGTAKLTADIKTTSKTLSLTWSSSSESVATVSSNGDVSAVAEGRALITVTTSDGVKASCELTVVREIINASSIKLNKETLSITRAGESATLSATILPENTTVKTVTWTSSNETVAVVDKFGKVTAKAEGIATITATTHNTKTATCMVVVGAPIIPVTNIALNKGTLSLKIGESDNLSASITPENATIKDVSWSSDNTTVATVDANGKVTAKAAGTAKITATCGDKSTACNVTVFLASGVFGNLSWTLTSEGALNINGTGAMPESGAIPWASHSNTIKVAIIGNGLTSISPNAFHNCGSLTSVNIPGSIKSIGSTAFSRCSNLISVTLPESVTSIGQSAFRGCTNLREINLPVDITSINESTFEDCTGLTEITIPAKVTNIYGGAFSGCSNLKKVTVLATVPPWLQSSGCFSVYNLLNVPSDSYMLYASSDWGRFPIINSI